MGSQKLHVKNEGVVSASILKQDIKFNTVNEGELKYEIENKREIRKSKRQNKSSTKVCEFEGKS
jgi:hypothetical protein